MLEAFSTNGRTVTVRATLLRWKCFRHENNEDSLLKQTEIIEFIIAVAVSSFSTTVGRSIHNA